MNMKTIESYNGAYFDNDYLVTDSGDIHRLVWSNKSNLFLSPFIDEKGYVHYTLYGLDKEGNTVQKNALAERLVAFAFVSNPDPENKIHVNHLDEKKKNNHPSNLVWVTPEENDNWGTRNERIRKALQKRVLCVETGMVYDSGRDAAKSVGVRHSAISRACNGKLKTVKGYHWQFAA